MNDVQRGFDLLRVTLEARVSGLAILAVTSARADDGTGVVASGLAEAFAQAGRDTLLVSAGADASDGSRYAPEVRAGLVRATAAQLGAGASGDTATLVAAVRSQRDRYGAIVIDAGALPGSALAFELARISDGVLVAVRLARRPCDEDRTALKLLDDARANVLGVVPTNVRAAAPASTTATGTAHDDGLRRLARPIEATRTR